MSAMHIAYPRAMELAFEPELASLAVLDAAIAIAVQALIARNPELLLPEDADCRANPQVGAARTLIVLFRDLDVAMRAYRELGGPSPPHDDDDYF